MAPNVILVDGAMKMTRLWANNPRQVRPEDARVDTVVARTEEALARAKAAGRNRVEVV